ncbi:MAG TPA: hypothetical protein VFK82_08605 [Burkholderiaceae bacterium]|nr:hypothetical protein [Burkholderiaceae bacterium]
MQQADAARSSTGLRARAMRGLAWVLLGALLGLTFAAYFSPALRVELSNFWALCVGALK